MIKDPDFSEGVVVGHRRLVFLEQCLALEKDGWTIDTFEPIAMFAIYRKNGESKQIGGKRNDR
jgi:DNA primase